MEDFIRDIKAPQLPDWLVKPGLLVIPMYKLCPKEFFRKWIWPKIIVEILVEPNPHPGVTQPIRWLGGNIAKSNPVVSFLNAILHRGLRNYFVLFLFFSPFPFSNLYLDFFIPFYIFPTKINRQNGSKIYGCEGFFFFRPFQLKNVKGQLISEWLYYILKFSKNERKNLMNFCPRL